MQTPLEDFISYKVETGMQCGNYSIDIPELKEGEQYRFHFDATACVGCRCCEVACNEQNNNPADVKWRRVGEMEAGSFPDTLMLFNSMSCNHCVDPACLIGCPTESYIKIDATGIVVHDDDTCIGCQYCTWNCPYGVPTYHEERKIVTKCHMCHERLDVGESPACVQACPAGAIMIETVNVDEWLSGDIDTEGNMPHLVDARVTNSTTRFTLPENYEEEMRRADEHHLKPFHSEMPLVFMTVLTQMSLGAFFGLFMGELLGLLGLQSPSWMLALLVVVPAAFGLPLSALHLGRPFLAMTAMKNIKSSWLSREALALGLFTAMMTINAGLYFFGVNPVLRLVFEALTLTVGLFGIYAQGMIYQIEARPSWNRLTTLLKFFGTAYTGLYLLAFGAMVLGHESAVVPLISAGMILAVAHGFFTFEDRRALNTPQKYERELVKTRRIYDELFPMHAKVRMATFIGGAILLPQIVTIFAGAGMNTASMVVLGLAFVLMVTSELFDRFLFYVTSVPLSMAGGFFVGNQR